MADEHEQGLCISEVKRIATQLGININPAINPGSSETPSVMQLYELCMIFFNKGKHSKHGQR